MNIKLQTLNRQNNMLDMKLDEQNGPIMTDMVCYIRTSNISECDQEIVRYDLLQMVLSAQARKENIETVIGEDYKAFCDEIVGALPSQSRKIRFMDFLDTVLLGIIVLGIIKMAVPVIELIRSAITGQTINYQFSISVGDLLAGLIIISAAFLIMMFIGKNAFNLKPQQNKKTRFLIGGIIGAGLMAFFILIHWFGKQPLFTVHIFIAGIFILAAYGVHRLYKYFSTK